MELMRLSVIIPAYNEERRIENTITSYVNYFDAASRGEYEIIAVCDGCTDRTPQIVEKISEKHKNVFCFRHPERLGKGGGILRSFKFAKGDIVGFVDADNAFEINGVEKLINLIDSGYDCAIGSKWKGRSFFQVTEPLFRKIGSRIWKLILRVLFGLRIDDAQAGAKFLRRKVLESLPPIRCTGFEFDAELLWRVSQRKFSIKEIYIPTRHREHGKFKMRDSISMLINILRLRLNIP